MRPRWLTSWATSTKVYRGNFGAPCSLSSVRSHSSYYIPKLEWVLKGLGLSPSAGSDSRRVRPSIVAPHFEGETFPFSVSAPSSAFPPVLQVPSHRFPPHPGGPSTCDVCGREGITKIRREYTAARLMRPRFWHHKIGLLRGP